MTLSIDDLDAIFIEARNAVEWEAERRNLCPSGNDMRRAGIIAVVTVLRDECDRVLPCDRKFSRNQVWDVFDEILPSGETKE